MTRWCCISGILLLLVSGCASVETFESSTHCKVNTLGTYIETGGSRVQSVLLVAGAHMLMVGVESLGASGGSQGHLVTGGGFGGVQPVSFNCVAGHEYLIGYDSFGCHETTQGRTRVTTCSWRPWVHLSRAPTQ